MLGVIGLILAIIFLMLFAYKGLGALPLAMAGALIAIIFNQMPVYDTLVSSFVPGYASAFTSYMLLFVSSAFYAKLMDVSGCATSIGNKFTEWFGIGHVVLVGIVIVGILTYGGVSLFVVIYAAAPILYTMLKKANLPRHLTVICFSAGSSTFSMTCLPGSPQLSNLVGTEYLGTSLNAAPLMGIVCGAAMFILCALYGEWATKKAREREEVWSYPANVDPKNYEVDPSQLPASWKGFLTIICLILIIIVGSHQGVNATLIAVAAMVVGSIMVIALNTDRFFGKVKWLKLFTEGMTSGVASIGGIAAILGFGAVVKATPAYQSIIDWALSLDMNPLLLAVVVTCIVCAIAGGSSSGQRIMYETMAPTFIASGANLPVLHRLVAIASGSLDTLPHSSGLFLVYDLLGLTHKDAYRHSFAVSVVVPLFVTIVATTICVVMGI
ncbi:MAG: GntP family permease [Oliverpabstia sp.]